MKQLSVVVAAWTGTEALERCVASLLADLDLAADEIIVARNCPWSARPGVIDLAGDRGATVPDLRAAGLAASSGRVVAFIEDHCVVTPGWRAAIVGAHDGTVAGVGGPVAAAPGARSLDDAVYLYDYYRFAPPLQDGAVGSLSGANMSYTRQFLDESGDLIAGGVLEVVLEAECRRRGLTLRIAPDATVVHAARHTASEAASLAFNLGRGYAARRGDQAGTLLRCCLALATPALPIVLGWRIGRRMATRWKLGRLAASLPWLAGLLITWAAGEGTGYAAGAGNSAKRWR